MTSVLHQVLAISFNAAVSVLHACRLDVFDKIYKMEKILRLLEGFGLAPNRSSANLYSLLLRTLSRQGTRRSTEKALGVLRELEVGSTDCCLSSMLHMPNCVAAPIALSPRFVPMCICA